MANEFAGKTYEEAVDEVAKESADALLAFFDGEVNMKDFTEAFEGGKAWNAAMKIPGMDKKTLFAHVMARLAPTGAQIALPLPEGLIPEVTE